MKISSKLVPMTATEIFKRQVSDIVQGVRVVRNDNVFIPLQLGGMFGQRTTLDESLVLSIISMDNSGRDE